MKRKEKGNEWLNERQRRVAKGTSRAPSGQLQPSKAMAQATSQLTTQTTHTAQAHLNTLGFVCTLVGDPSASHCGSTVVQPRDDAHDQLQLAIAQSVAGVGEFENAAAKCMLKTKMEARTTRKKRGERTKAESG